MGEAQRDAYVLACIELEAASKALEAAQARVDAARAECGRLEAALNMTQLSDGPFPERGCSKREQREMAALLHRKHAGRG